MYQRRTGRAPRIIKIKPVKLNRNGIVIGHIVKVAGRNGMFWAYMSPRRAEHYFIKYRGYGLNQELLHNLLTEWRIENIIIHYQGKRGEKYLLSNIDKWFESGIRVEYSKDMGDSAETYSVQKILPEREMTPL